MSDSAPARLFNPRSDEVLRHLFARWRAGVGVVLVLVGLMISSSVTAAAPGDSAPGLKVTFTSKSTGSTNQSDVTVRPNVWLYVLAGEAPTSFLPPGPFTALWEGSVSLDLRSQYSFQAEFNGTLRLELNGTAILETNSTGAAPISTPLIRLNRGANALKAFFASPAQGDASVRLQWEAKGVPLSPIPVGALTHQPDTELRTADQLRLGRQLFVEHRCVKCHIAPPAAANLSSLAMDAPSFEKIGSRRNQDWLGGWILDPKAERASARMPRMLHGSRGPEDAAAMAAFLASLQGDSFPRREPTEEEREAGQTLFDQLHCAACHQAPGEADGNAIRLSLAHVRLKFAPGSIEPFLTQPEAHYAWTRMPNFKLSDEEAGQLAAYLEANAAAPSAASAAADATLIERGKKLVQTVGCLNCHGLKLENEHAAPALLELSSIPWNRGCVADGPEARAKAPDFGFSHEERSALEAFGPRARASLERHVPAESVEREIRNLNCRECHGKLEGVPPMGLGEKLKPEWAHAFIAGKLSYKPRPWIDARMPAFERWADGLVRGMAMLHGYPPRTTPEPPIDPELSMTGRTLISAVGGLSCIGCHAVGDTGATQALESSGINLAYTNERLRKQYFERWIRNPLAIDPTTKMPVYFDEEGLSPITDIFEGDGARQIDAMWEYIRLGEKMPPPPVE